MLPVLLVLLLLSGCANVPVQHYTPTADEVRANMATFKHYDVEVLHTECYDGECDTWEE